ncbi:MAG: ParB/RepB/Spo0J family partition protein [Deltaproteobacteria bacterium]|nr:ParB/RepB/Spo0J family partition protein [Deltaproteobacteria bacterium]
MTTSRALGKGLASLIPIKNEEREDYEASQPISPESQNKIIKKPSSPQIEVNSLEKIEKEANTPEKAPIKEVEKSNLLQVKVEDIFPSSSQPRKMFNKTPLTELAASIKEQGIIQPLIVRRAEGGKFELIAGERRLRASKMLGLSQVPVVISEVAPEKIFEMALIENIQREDLNPIEEALAYRELQERYQLTQEQIAQRVGKDRSSVANIMRLLQLPKEVRAEIIANRISMGHARALLGLENDTDKINLKNQILKNNLSVREVEELVKKLKEEGDKKIVRRASVLNPQHRYLEEKLTQNLGTKVKIQSKGLRGKIVIEYYQPEELDRLYEMLTS